VQGGLALDLRRRSAEDICALDLPGYDVDGPAGANYNGLIDPDATDPISGTVALRSYLCEVRRGEP